MNWIILLIISMLPLIGLLPEGLPVTHDGPDHVARIASFFASLSEGNVIPRWASNLNWGYGHPILMFLYPMSSYVGSLFHWMGLGYVDATKMVFAFAFTASILAMYLWVKTAFGKRAGVIAAMLYGFAPYRFVDLYVRGAIGEHMAFVFPPLICYFLFLLSNTAEYSKNRQLVHGIGLTLSVGALILSHNAVAIMFLPVIGLYWIYLFFTQSKKSMSFVIPSVYFFLLGFGIAAFFWMPAFFEGKYTLRDIVTSNEYGSRFVPIRWFFYSAWKYGQGNELTKSVGIAQWLGIFVSLAVMWKMKEKSLRVFIIGLVVLFFGSLFMMTSASSGIWQHISLLQKFQFPWRFLSVSVFLSAILGGVSIASIIERRKLNKRLVGNYVVSVFCIIAVVSTVYMWKPKAYSQKSENFYSGIYESTTDTGESSPIWSVRFMEHRPTSPLEIAEGAVIITHGNRTTTTREYSVEAKEPARLVENTLYFPGWKVYVDGVQTGIQYQDPTYRGLITFRVTEGTHTVRIVFEDTKLRYVADMITLGTIGILLVTALGVQLWKKRA
ncbi:MAG: hypothetical protein WAV51_02975 [Microgenomates group bacterium]